MTENLHVLYVFQCVSIENFINLLLIYFFFSKKLLVIKLFDNDSF